LSVLIDLHPTRPDRIAITAPYRFKDLIKTCPGARWNKDEKEWSIPLAWSACMAMRGIFGHDLQIGPGLEAWAWTHKANIIEPLLAWRTALDGHGDERLYPYQRAGVVWLKHGRRVLLADEMGTGKTIQSITALHELATEGYLVGPIMIVCPNSMKGTWKRELATWWPDVFSVVIGGTAAQRRRQIESFEAAVAEGKQAALIINWESLRAHSRLVHFGSTALRRCKACGGEENVKEAQCEVHERELNRIDFAAVVADEAHRMLDPHSKQTRALRAASGKAEIRFALTGTPISDDPSELWTILNWIDEAEWPTKSAWVERLVDYVYNMYGGREINGLNPLTEGEFQWTVWPRMRRMLKQVVLPYLPPIVHETRYVKMDAKQAKQYNDMRDLLVAKLDMGTLLASDPMVQVGRLTQLASASGDIAIRKVPKIDPVTKEPVLDPETGQPALVDEEYMVVVDPSNKIDAFMDDIPDFEGQSVIVFAESRQLIELLSARMAKKSIPHGLLTGAVKDADREAVIQGFQNGDFPFILITIKTGGTGITLTKASVACYIQRNWSPIEMNQSYGRWHRIGSEIHDSILRIDYVTEDTIEDAQIEVLGDKGKRLEEIVRDEDAIRRLLKGEAP
jgi:SNF2 family DNA or RNA helicase